MTDSSENVQVTDNPDSSRFELHVDGELTGHAEYQLRSDRMLITHTEVDPALQGRGLAGTLARGALDAARAGGRRVIPLCSYVADYIRKHPEYADLVDPI